MGDIKDWSAWADVSVVSHFMFSLAFISKAELWILKAVFSLAAWVWNRRKDIPAPRSRALYIHYLVAFRTDSCWKVTWSTNDLFIKLRPIDLVLEMNCTSYITSHNKYSFQWTHDLPDPWQPEVLFDPVLEMVKEILDGQWKCFWHILNSRVMVNIASCTGLSWCDSSASYPSLTGLATWG